MACGLGALSGCATSPTGRSQLTLIPESQMTTMGSQAFQEMKAQTPNETSTPLALYVKCVARPIAAASGSGIAADRWEIVLFRDDSANAFALPGGKIGVHTGLLKVAKTDAQLAAVLGHEVGHVIAKHGNERVSQNLVTQGGLAALDAILFGKDQANSSKRQLLMAGLGLGAQVGVLLPFSRKQESEADEIGLSLMAKVGFDPRESVQLWRNMIAGSGGGGPPEFLSTHPASENRIKDLQARMGPALASYERHQAKNPGCRRP